MSKDRIDQLLDLAHVPDALPSTADHSSLPWKYCGCGKCGHIWSLPADFHVATAIQKTEDGEMTAEERQANAEFIVKACNAHDDLVKVEQSARLFVDHINSFGGSFIPGEINASIDTLRDALALVEMEA